MSSSKKNNNNSNQLNKILFQTDLKNITYAMTKQDYDRLIADRTCPIGHVVTRRDTRKNLA